MTQKNKKFLRDKIQESLGVDKEGAEEIYTSLFSLAHYSFDSYKESQIDSK